MDEVSILRLSLSVRVEPSRRRRDVVELSSRFWSKMGPMRDGKRGDELHCDITTTRRRRTILGSWRLF